MVTGESTKETVKTIAQGMPVDAVYPWLLTPVLFFCTGGHGWCAEYERQLGGGSPLSSLMTAKD
jgi:hypothetical protein